MVNHVLCLVTRSSATLRTISRGRETRTSVSAGTVHCRPADGEEYVILGQPATGDHSWFGFLIPDGHLASIADSEGISKPIEYREQVLRDDARLQSYLLRLGGVPGASQGANEDDKESIARRIVLRLTELSGGGVPGWHTDASVFERHTVRHLVEYIDAHLHVSPRLPDLAMLTGLSPGHFAKKFHQSTGLSLHRFINRRRILRSLNMLTNQSQSLAGVALDLGFSSQSHFTRLFSDLTGMTPAKYRKQFRRTVG